MRSLFWKIFLSFWLLITALVLVLVITVSNRKSDRLDFFRVHQLALVSNSSDYAVAEYERAGAAGLAAAMKKIDGRIRGELWIVDEKNQPIQGGTLPAEIGAVLTMTDDVTPQDKFVLVRAPFEHEGKRYLALARLQQSRGPRVPPGQELAMQIPLAVLVSSLICWVLARYIARPVTALRVAAQRIAEGDLEARADARFEGRDELGELTRDFNQMAARLEATLSAQQRMFADVSHELRSPLSRLTLALELAKQRAGPAAATALERIEIEAGRLNDLVQQVLRLAKLESGVISDKHEVVSLTEVLGDVVADAEIEANAKQCTVVLKNEVSALVEGDADVLRSALENVVRNAIEYSPQQCQIELVQRRCGASSVAIEVADSGPGVAAEELTRMFEPFYRSDGARANAARANGARRSPGVGLGLAIAERAVKAHHGSIRAANREQSGLKIEIRLPLFGVETT
ncbi:MAG: ATP-binding protein [Acidobacteriota bacterium]|nr:ATP-binding protein [Acidobacteriota bacterium]